MAFLSHLRPKRMRIIPTASRRISIGTYLTSATPSVATISASVAAAANAPTSELRQLIVTPTTRTIVKASTNSTAEAKNAAVATAHCMQYTPLLPKDTFTMRYLFSRELKGGRIGLPYYEYCSTQLAALLLTL